jgi:hypothetical protein
MVANARWVGRAASQQTVRAAAVVVVAGVTYLVVVNSKQGQSEQQLKEMEIKRGEGVTPMLPGWQARGLTKKRTRGLVGCFDAEKQLSARLAAELVAAEASQKTTDWKATLERVVPAIVSLKLNSPKVRASR